MSCSPSSLSLHFFSSSSSLLSASSFAAATFHSKDSFFPPKQPKFPSKKIFISASLNRDNVRTIRTVEIANSITDRGGSPPGEPPTGVDGGGGGGEEDDDNKEEEEEFGPVMKFEDVIREAEARGATLPSDMLDAAKSIGIRRLLLVRYLDLQASPWPLGVAMRSCSLLRNRMLADPSFLFKVGTEVVIDACCGTFAEIQKRGEDFWPEFELYAADLLVGVVVDIALVGLLAPYVRFGKPASSAGIFGGISRACDNLPSSVFEAERPGSRFSIKQRIGTYFYKGVLYGSVGFVCGIIGQGIANLFMTAKRNWILFCIMDSTLATNLRGSFRGINKESRPLSSSM
ncbi:protein RETICULATA-RELATED 1, chloroplastic isoform X2 [Dendrobium catenatum]|uniref:protein RETICULATA-RELATED 1, chloroplastic isoform X2 n=1 Tax=Dendrobium catenatum TaxID=906689 RepID=UPI0010A057B9|nr:protein RETICULATA-RELATED 1, chloroplastic isoform X2 [Dendrobium catenatum]